MRKWKALVLVAAGLVLGLLLLQRVLNRSLTAVQEETNQAFQAAGRGWLEAAGVAKGILKHPGNEWTQEDVNGWQTIFLTCSDLGQASVLTMLPNPMAPAIGRDAPNFGSLWPQVERIREIIAGLEQRPYQEDNVARFLPAFHRAVGDAGL